ncbi:MAG TPA: HEAT repeat domain-containing protein [Chloroflexia bacterium]|jgi:hypothetical protein
MALIPAELEHRILHDLQALLRSASAYDQKAAARVLAMLGTKARQGLLDALDEADSPTVVSAATALIRSGDSDVAGRLLLLLGSDNPERRLIAAWTVGLLKIDGATDRLIALLSDVDEFVRAAAAIALGFARMPEAVDSLTASLKDPVSVVRKAALLALMEIEPEWVAETILTDNGTSQDDVWLAWVVRSKGLLTKGRGLLSVLHRADVYDALQPLFALDNSTNPDYLSEIFFDESVGRYRSGAEWRIALLWDPSIVDSLVDTYVRNFGSFELIPLRVFYVFSRILPTLGNKHLAVLLAQLKEVDSESSALLRTGDWSLGDTAKLLNMLMSLESNTLVGREQPLLRAVKGEFERKDIPGRWNSLLELWLWIAETESVSANELARASDDLAVPYFEHGLRSIYDNLLALLPQFYLSVGHGWRTWQEQLASLSDLVLALGLERHRWMSEAEKLYQSILSRDPGNRFAASKLSRLHSEWPGTMNATAALP